MELKRVEVIYVDITFVALLGIVDVFRICVRNS